MGPDWRAEGDAHEFFDRSHNKAAAPSLDVFGLEDCSNSLDKSPAAGVSQAYNHQSLVSPQLKPTDIRKVEVLRDEESPGFL